MSMCDYCISNGVCNQPLWILKAVEREDLYCDNFRAFSMPKISMNRTTSPFVTKNKGVTRRNWQPVTIKRFKKDTKFLGVQRCYGGEALGIGKMIEDCFEQSTKVMPDGDYVNEGFEHLDVEMHRLTGTMPLKVTFCRWRNADAIMTVVPFEIVEVFPGMMVKYTTDKEIIRCVKALVRAIG